MTQGLSTPSQLPAVLQLPLHCSISSLHDIELSSASWAVAKCRRGSPADLLNGSLPPCGALGRGCRPRRPMDPVPAPGTPLSDVRAVRPLAGLPGMSVRQPAGASRSGDRTEPHQGAAVGGAGAGAKGREGEEGSSGPRALGLPLRCIVAAAEQPRAGVPAPMRAARRRKRSGDACASGLQQLTLLLGGCKPTTRTLPGCSPKSQLYSQLQGACFCRASAFLPFLACLFVARVCSEGEMSEQLTRPDHPPPPPPCFLLSSCATGSPLAASVRPAAVLQLYL